MYLERRLNVFLTNIIGRVFCGCTKSPTWEGGAFAAELAADWPSVLPMNAPPLALPLPSPLNIRRIIVIRITHTTSAVTAEKIVVSRLLAGC